MKALAALFIAALPAGAVTPGTIDPDFGCDYAKGFCVVKVEALRELIHGQKQICQRDA